MKKKVWIEYKGKPIMGEGRYMLLKSINKTSSVKKSAQIVGVSEKTAHNHIHRMEQRIGKKIIISEKGGKNAGAKTRLTAAGEALLRKYEVAK